MSLPRVLSYMVLQASHEPLLKSLHYLLLISEVDDTEISKICLEYWNALAADLYRSDLELENRMIF